MLLGLFVQVGERALQSAGTSALRECDGVVRADIEGIQVILGSFYVSLSTKKGTDQVAQAYFCPVFLIEFQLIRLTIARVCFLLKSVCSSVWHGQRQGTWF